MVFIFINYISASTICLSNHVPPCILWGFGGCSKTRFVSAGSRSKDGMCWLHESIHRWPHWSGFRCLPGRVDEHLQYLAAAFVAAQHRTSEWLNLIQFFR